MTSKRKISKPATTAADQASTAIPGMRLAWSMLALLAVYLLAWGAASFTHLGPVDQAGAYPMRFELLVRLLYPEDLLALWFDGFTVRGLVARLPVLLLASLLLSSAAAWGDMALRRFPRLDWLLPAERLIVATTVGLNALSLATLLLAWLTPPGVQAVGLWLTVSGSILYGAARLLRAPRQLRPRSIFWTRLDCLLVPLVAIVVAAGLLPPTDFDVREYHLQAPKEFFQRGGVEFLGHNVYANMPLGAEMYALAAMRMTGDWRLGALAGKLVIALFAPLAALAIKCAGQRWVSPWAGSAGAILYLATPWVLGVSVNGLIEGAYAHYLFAVVALLLAAIFLPEARDSRAALLALAGFAAGGAAATKYPALLFAVAIPLGGWLALARDRRWQGAALFLAAAAVGGGPWYLKNAVLAGNPTYPLLEGVAGTNGDADGLARFDAAHRPPGYSLPDLTRRAIDFAGRSELHSPLLMPFAALAFADSRRRRGVWLLAGWIAIYMAGWWLFTHRIDRFWVPVLPSVALLAGVGASWLVERLRAPIVSALLIAAALWGCFLSAGGIMAYNRLLADLDSCWTDLSRVPEWIEWLNRNTPPGERVVSEGDAALFDLTAETIYHTAFDRSPLADWAQERSAGELRRELAARRIAYVYVNHQELARYRQPGNYGFDPRVTRELFERLVKAGVLGPPIDEFRDRGVEIFPVIRGGNIP